MTTPPAAPFADASLFAVDSRRILRVAMPAAEAARDADVQAELQRLGAWNPSLPTLLIDGVGTLSRILHAGGAKPFPAASAVTPSAGSAADAILLSVSDGPAPEHWIETDARARELGFAWMCAWCEGPAAFVSPLLAEPADPGFVDAALRRRATEPQPAARAALLEQQRQHPMPPAAALAHTVCAQMSARVATPEARARARQTLAVIQPDASVSEHRVLPWPRGIQEEPIP